MINDKNKKVIFLIARATGGDIEMLEKLSPELLKQAEAVADILDKVRANKL